MQNNSFFKARYLLILLLLLVPVFYPQIDLFVSQIFYLEAEGFYLKNLYIIQFLYQSVEVLLYPLLVAILLAYAYQSIRKMTFRYFNRKALLYLLSVFVIGSGLIVNMGLKEHMGRARPRQVVLFGGDKQFTPPCVVTDQTPHNGSFSCGHCSFAFGFLALYFLYRRKWILVVTLGYGILVSGARIVQGGHFLSDALYSAIIMWVVAKSIHYYLYQLKPSE